MTGSPEFANLTGATAEHLDGTWQLNGRSEAILCAPGTDNPLPLLKSGRYRRDADGTARFYTEEQTRFLLDHVKFFADIGANNLHHLYRSFVAFGRAFAAFFSPTNEKLEVFSLEPLRQVASLMVRRPEGAREFYAVALESVGHDGQGFPLFALSAKINFGRGVVRLPIIVSFDPSRYEAPAAAAASGVAGRVMRGAAMAIRHFWPDSGTDGDGA